MDEKYEALKRAGKNGKDPKMITRAHFVIMVKYHNLSINEASKLLSRCFNWGKNCMERYEKEGINGLQTLPNPGSPNFYQTANSKK